MTTTDATPAPYADVAPTPTSAGSPRLLTARDLAEFLQLDEERLYDMRAAGTGPAFVKIGRDVRYTWPDVREWLAEHKRRSTRAA